MVGPGVTELAVGQPQPLVNFEKSLVSLALGEVAVTYFLRFEIPVPSAV